MDWIEKARNQVSLLLENLPGDVSEATKDTVVDYLCKELEKIPVPFLGTILSKTVKSFVQKEGNSTAGVEGILEMLRQMESSDDEFRSGLSGIGVDIDRLGERITSVEQAVLETRYKLTVPDAIISDPDLKIRYPVFDNELEFGLFNIGGGAIKVPEIELIVEDKKPEVMIDYSVPAAPPVFLALKVKLSADVKHYPLLKLNNEPFRRFGAFSEGAEDVLIQMSSDTNARYFIRVRIPFKDVSTNEESELFYPPIGSPALEVPFWYAPAWNSEITPDTMLARSDVLNRIITTFQDVTAILEDTHPSDDSAYVDNLNKKISNAGIQLGINDFPGMHDMLVIFLPDIVRMGELEEQQIMFDVILRLYHQLLRFSPPSPMSGPLSGGMLCSIVKKPQLEGAVTKFILNEDEIAREKELSEILF